MALKEAASALQAAAQALSSKQAKLDVSAIWSTTAVAPSFLRRIHTLGFFVICRGRLKVTPSGLYR